MRETIAMKKKLFFLCLVSCLAMAAACGRQEPPPGTREDASLGQEQGSLETQEPEEREEADNSASQPMAPVPESEAGDVEHYESVPYRLYPTSEGAWVGDVMPMADEDGLQLYYYMIQIIMGWDIIRSTNFLRQIFMNTGTMA